jgi:hypothetical protein
MKSITAVLLLVPLLAGCAGTFHSTLRSDLPYVADYLAPMLLKAEASVVCPQPVSQVNDAAMGTGPFASGSVYSLACTQKYGGTQ